MKLCKFDPPDMSVIPFLRYLGFDIQGFFYDKAGECYISHVVDLHGRLTILNSKLKDNGTAFMLLFTQYNKILRAYKMGRSVKIKLKKHAPHEIRSNLEALFSENKNKSKIHFY